MKNIQFLSKALLLIFKFMLVLMPVSLIAFWVNAPEGSIAKWLGVSWSKILTVNYTGQGITILHQLSLTTKILGLLISLIPFTLHIFILWMLIKLFTAYSRKNIFSLQNVRYIRNIGILLLVGELVSPIHQALLSAALTWNNPPGHREITISFVSSDLGVILCSIMIILVAWIMAEAYKHQENNKLFV
jgi:hypothetical protein